nr:MAG TPA: hypothetical protein [Caudoviricetes sp.]
MKQVFYKLLYYVSRDMGQDTADLLERWFTEYMTCASALTHAPYILRGILYTIRASAGDRSMAAYYATMCLNRMNDFDWRGSHL